MAETARACSTGTTVFCSTGGAGTSFAASGSRSAAVATSVSTPRLWSTRHSRFEEVVPSVIEMRDRITSIAQIYPFPVAERDGALAWPVMLHVRTNPRSGRL